MCRWFVVASSLRESTPKFAPLQSKLIVVSDEDVPLSLQTLYRMMLSESRWLKAHQSAFYAYMRRKQMLVQRFGLCVCVSIDCFIRCSMCRYEPYYDVLPGRSQQKGNAKVRSSIELKERRRCLNPIPDIAHRASSSRLDMRVPIEGLPPNTLQERAGSSTVRFVSFIKLSSLFCSGVKHATSQTRRTTSSEGDCPSKER